MHKQPNRTMIKAFRLFLAAALLAGLALVTMGAVGVMLLRLRSGQVLRARRRR